MFPSFQDFLCLGGLCAKNMLDVVHHYFELYQIFGMFVKFNQLNEHNVEK